MKLRLVLAAGAAVLAAAAAALGGGFGASAQAAQAAAPPALTVQSCIGNSFCVATGSQPGRPGSVPVTEEWNGKSWRILPNPKGGLGGITCGGPSFCLMDVLVSPGHLKEVAWNGRAWRQFKPQPPDLPVTCLSPRFCVGLYSDRFGEFYWTGGPSWSPMPDTSSGCGGAWCTTQSFSCGSATNCQDSGSYCGDDDCDDGTFDYSDIWNGTTWSDSTQNPSPGFGGQQGCAGRAFCMVLDPPSQAAITNDWSASWQSASVHLAAACHHLASCTQPTLLACGSSHFCTATTAQSPTAALVWNGARWGVAKLVLVSGHAPKLTALACGGPSNCVATGTYQLSPRGAVRPIAEHWNGKAWSLTRIATP
jgi:hypothetical protein